MNDSKTNKESDHTLRTDDPVADLLLSGQADTVAEAEELYLESHLDEVVQLAESELSDDDFRRHPLISLLLARGSRGWEDSVS